MLWSTSLSSDSSTCVSHFISEMIFDRVINSTPVAVWCLKPLVWPRNHEHKVVLSVLYLTFFDSIQRFGFLIDSQSPPPPRRDLNFSEMRSQRFRPNASAAQAATRSQKRLDQWWVTILHWQKTKDKHEKTFLFVESIEKERETDHPVESNWAFTATYVSLPIVHHHHSHNHYCQLSHSLQCNEHINVLVALTFLALLIPSFHSWQQHIVQKTVQP